MQYFVEKGLSHKETIEKIKNKYGDQAKIMTFKTVRLGGFLGIGVKEGVEMAGYVQMEPVRKRPMDLDAEKQKIFEAAASVKNSYTAQGGNTAQVSKSLSLPVDARNNQDKAVSLQDILREITDIKEKVGAKGGGNGSANLHPNIGKLKQVLINNEFSESFIGYILDTLRKQFTLEALDDYDLLEKSVIDLIGGLIQVGDEPEVRDFKIMTIIGPTGVGKTTVIAKLAAVYGRLGMGDMKPVDVRIITADNYRIGAVNQLEVYGKIMEVPFASVDSQEELKNRLELFSEATMILVDTSGRSPKNYASLGEMQEMLTECRKFASGLSEGGNAAEYHLALSATTKTADIYEILKQFDSFDYKSVILTKLDETMRIGNVLSVLWEKQKPLSFITFGQGVPYDISRASVPELMKYLDGFHIDWEHVRKKFTHNR